LKGEMMAIGIATNDSNAMISVVGVGGGGGNAINNMIASGLKTVLFIAANTDKQALDKNQADNKIQMGRDQRGLGAGAKPEVGKIAAEDSIDEFKEFFKTTEMVFVTAGMGGGTGTGAAPVIAKIAKDSGNLVVGIVTKPFTWEGKKRQELAENGIEELRQNVDALIVIPNQKLLDIINIDVSFVDAFKMVDEVLYNATKGISDIIANTGHVNVDFADVKTIMSGMGDAIMGIGRASGQDRASNAAISALKYPLLEGITIRGSKGVLVNVTGGTNLSMTEVASAVSLIQQAAGDDANLIHGVVIDESLKDEIMVTVVATGFKSEDVIFNNPKTELAKPVEIITTEPKPNNVMPPLTPRFDKAYNNTVIKFPVTLPSKAPKGEEELRNFDTPTIVRRHGVDLSNIGVASMNRYERVNEVNFSKVK